MGKQSKGIVAIDYNGQRIQTGIALDEVDTIHVTVLTGDEVLDIVTKDGRTIHFDSCPDGRIGDFYDGTYFVTAENLKKWQGRNDSYTYICGVE